jgi:glycosyltransferase involved in cell wall biosynthesis
MRDFICMQDSPAISLRSSRPDITVLMSVYNGRPYLNEAVESIVEQTHEDFEFLIIDDASTDGSRSILEEWAGRDGRIRLILHDENRGLGYALAEGIKEARAPWIARMDDDDIAFPDRLERQVQYLEEHPNIDILSSWAIEIDAQGEPIRLRQVPTSHEDIIRLIWTIPVIHPAVLFRRESIQRVGSYSSALRRRQDYDLWFRCAAAGLRFANIPEPLIYYRFTDDYYSKNDLRTALDQVQIGWKGCRMVGASPVAYVGVMAPLVRALLPKRLSKFIQLLLHKFDPRQEQAGNSRREINEYHNVVSTS